MPVSTQSDADALPPLQAVFQKWHVGDVVVTKIIEIENQQDGSNLIPKATPEAILEMPWLAPDFVTEEGLIKISVHALVIETPKLRIIVDTCFGNDKGREPWPGIDKRQLPFLQDFEAAGFSRESIDVVLCTHLHIDHVGWNTMLVDDKWVPTFPNARYLFNRTEYEYWKAGEGVTTDRQFDVIQRLTFNDSVLPVVEAGLVELVEGTHQVCDEVRLIPTIGHSPGHVSVWISSRGEEAMITGDMAHHPCQLEHVDWATALDSDPAQSIRTRQEMFSKLAGTPVLVIGTHWAGRTAGNIYREGDSFRLT